MTRHWLRKFEKLNETENYISMHSQRIVRKYNTFPTYQYQEIEKINRMERLQITSRKSEIPREFSCKEGHNKGQKWYQRNRTRRN